MHIDSYNRLYVWDTFRRVNRGEKRMGHLLQIETA